MGYTCYRGYDLICKRWLRGCDTIVPHGDIVSFRSAALGVSTIYLIGGVSVQIHVLPKISMNSALVCVFSYSFCAHRLM